MKSETVRREKIINAIIKTYLFIASQIKRKQKGSVLMVEVFFLTRRFVVNVIVIIKGHSNNTSHFFGTFPVRCGIQLFEMIFCKSLRLRNVK